MLSIHQLTNELQIPGLNLESFVYGGTNSVGETSPISTLNFHGLLWRTFLLHPQENGDCRHAKLVDHIVDFDDLQTAREDQLHIKSMCKIKNSFVSYNQLMNYMEQHIEPEEIADAYLKFQKS